MEEGSKMREGKKSVCRGKRGGSTGGKSVRRRKNVWRGKRGGSSGEKVCVEGTVCGEVRVCGGGREEEV